MGLVYALVWLAAADLAASRGRRASAAFHGTTAVLIALPLLWEASTRFGLLAPRAAAAVLAAFTGVALFVSWRRKLQSLAAAASLGALALALALVAATGEVGPFAVLTILVGDATLWLGYDCGWFWLRWPAAIAADFVVLGLVSRATGAERLESWQAGVAIPLFLLFAYLASLDRSRDTTGR